MGGFHHSLCHPCLSLILYTKAPLTVEVCAFHVFDEIASYSIYVSLIHIRLSKKKQNMLQDFLFLPHLHCIANPQSIGILLTIV